MTVCAIIAEYNPLHSGHLYHIERTRAALPGDSFLVAVMSGHAVQRGDFPILSKYARTRMALRAGFDLVLELPSPVACAPAERFARGAAGILSRLGVVTHLSFGAECGDIDTLAEASRLRPEAYPKDASLASAMPALFPGHAGLFTPNNILAVEYLRALRETDILPIAVERRGDAHDAGESSAGAIRRRVMRGGNPDIPFADIWEDEVSAGRAPVFLKSRSDAVVSYLRRLTAADWERVPDTSGGLSNRLFGAAARAGALEELYEAAKTKRYTLARIRRCVLCAFLGITEDMALARPHLRILGIGGRGTELLSHIKTPLISRPAANREALAAEAAVTDQFSFFMPSPPPSGMEWREGVIRL